MAQISQIPISIPEPTQDLAMHIGFIHSPALISVRQHRRPRVTARLSGLQAATAVGVIAASIVTCADPTLGYGLVDGRLQKCRGDDPCVSTTSVGNPTKFGAPWSYTTQTDDGDVAWESLKQAVAKNSDGGTIVDISEDPSSSTYYLRAEFPSFIRGIDDVEFKLMKKDKLVLYRSSAREPIYVYPIQAPINSNKNRTRLADIRDALGWVEDAAFDQ